MRSLARTFSGSSALGIFPTEVSKQARHKLELLLSVFVVTEGEPLPEEATQRGAKLRRSEGDQVLGSTGLRIVQQLPIVQASKHTNTASSDLTQGH